MVTTITSKSDLVSYAAELKTKSMELNGTIDTIKGLLESVPSHEDFPNLTTVASTLSGNLNNIMQDMEKLSLLINNYAADIVQSDKYDSNNAALDGITTGSSAINLGNTSSGVIDGTVNNYPSGGSDNNNYTGSYHGGSSGGSSNSQNSYFTNLNNDKDGNNIWNGTNNNQSNENINSSVDKNNVSVENLNNNNSNNNNNNNSLSGDHYVENLDSTNNSLVNDGIDPDVGDDYADDYYDYDNDLGMDVDDDYDNDNVLDNDVSMPSIDVPSNDSNKKSGLGGAFMALGGAAAVGAAGIAGASYLKKKKENDSIDDDEK